MGTGKMPPFLLGRTSTDVTSTRRRGALSKREKSNACLTQAGKRAINRKRDVVSPGARKSFVIPGFPETEGCKEDAARLNKIRVNGLRLATVGGRCKQKQRASEKAGCAGFMAARRGGRQSSLYENTSRPNRQIFSKEREDELRDSPGRGQRVPIADAKGGELVPPKT